MVLLVMLECQSKNDSVQTLWALPKEFPKQRNYVLFNEVGNKLNENKRLWYFLQTIEIIPVKNLCPQILFGRNTAYFC